MCVFFRLRRLNSANTSLKYIKDMANNAFDLFGY